MDLKDKNIEERLTESDQLVKMAVIVAKEVLTFDEAATFTGLSKSYLYKLTSGQKIPFYKPTGKLCFFNRLELQAWLQQNRIATTEEVQTQAQNYCMNNKKGGTK